MNDISVLEELGLQEVSRKTHIEVEYLQKILDKEFDKLNRVNTLGFIKILEREYQLDLSNWVSEFDAYCAENRPEEKKREIYHTNKISLQSKKSNGGFGIIILILLILGLVYLAWYFKLTDYVKEYIKQANVEQNTSYSSLNVVEKAKENLDNFKKDENETVVLEVVDINSTNPNDETIEIVPLNEENVTADFIGSQQEDENKQDENLTDRQKEKKNEEAVINKNLAKLDSAKKDNKEVGISKLNGMIYPNIQLWMGILYLDNGKKKSILTNKPYKVDLSRDQLIVTGHGNFKLGLEDNKTKDFNSKDRVRFYVKNGNMSQITLDEFKKINEGKKAW